MRTYKIYQIVLLLTPFVFSFAFGLDIYIPIVPQMSEIFETSPALVNLTLSLFLFFTGFGQLLIGPLSDRFGRRIIMLASSFCYLLGSLFCAVAPNITCLILARLICSIGACGMLTTSFAIVRDLYSGRESARIYSFINGAIGISPTFAPMIGGYLAVYLGWQSVFIFLALLGLLSMGIGWSLIGETHAIDMRTPIDRTLFMRYRDIFINRQFLTYSLISGFAESVFFCFFSISPFIIIDLLAIPTEHFGYYFSAFGCAIAAGGFIGGKIINKFGGDFTIILGFVLMCLGGGSMLAWHYWLNLSLLGFLFPMALACTGAIFIVGACASAALEPFGQMAGTAAAAFGALEFSMAAIIGSLLMLFPVHSTMPYGIVILLVTSLSLIAFRQRPLEALSESQTT